MFNGMEFAPALFAFSLGMQEMIIIGVIGVLLFGKRLPEVGKSLGKTFGEFKRGMQGFSLRVVTLSSLQEVITLFGKRLRLF